MLCAWKTLDLWYEKQLLLKDVSKKKEKPPTMNPWDSLLAFLLVLLLFRGASAQLRSPGTWHLLVENAGISAMHMVLTHNNKVVVFDGSNAGPSNISQPSGECRPSHSASEDCTAHSVEYDISSNSIRPLSIHTDTWCSSGAVLEDGTLVQIGGYQNGSQIVRYFSPCHKCDWYESPTTRLAAKRWYSSSHILPDNRVIVVGGRGQFNYEFVPRNEGESVHELPFLAESNDLSQDNLYPFLHLSPDGNLFVFANSDSILLDYKSNKVIRKLPTMPGLEARNYPSTGSSVMLPLDAATAFKEAEVLICGGAAAYNYAQASRGNFLNASQNCGRIKITDPSPRWTMEAMPVPRVMGDMLLLPTADVLIINGAQKGTAGWHNAHEPALSPVLYKPHLKLYGRFQTLATATRPRLHHSSAILLPDARILVGGSNPNTKYSFTAAAMAPPPAAAAFFPTDISLEAFHPPYLDPDYAVRRPRISFISTSTPLRAAPLTIRFQLRGHFQRQTLGAAIIAPPLASHASSMNQRMLRLAVGNVTLVMAPETMTGQVPTYDIATTMPGSPNAAPSGYYMLFVVHAGLPSHAAWIKLH